MILNPTGVIWAGPVYSLGGYGNVSRNYIKGLTDLGIPVRIINLDRIYEEIGSKNKAFLDSLTNTYVGSRPVLVIHHTPPLFDKIKVPGVYKKIGCTIFETDRIPKEWVKSCNNMDEIWVPSHFNLETFSKSGVKTEKIKVIPYSVDTEIFNTKVKPILSPKLKKFKFLYVFNYSYRKAPELLLEAFLKEFRQHEDVCLVLKVINTDYPNLKFDKSTIEKVTKKLKINKKNLPQVRLINTPSAVDELSALYASCDCYVSVDRANGWGMPCMEAMAIRKPAATVNWSGSTEFMNKNNSFLIYPKGLIKVDKKFCEINPLYRNHKWANIKITDLRKLLRHIYKNTPERIKIASNGYNTIVNSFSIYRISQISAKQLGFSYIKTYNRFRYFLNIILDIKRKGLKKLYLRIWRQLIYKINHDD